MNVVTGEKEFVLLEMKIAWECPLMLSDNKVNVSVFDTVGIFTSKEICLDFIHEKFRDAGEKNIELSFNIKQISQSQIDIIKEITDISVNGELRFKMYVLKEIEKVK